jgi:bifunctional DNase/RNase
MPTIEMEIESVRSSSKNDQWTVNLKEKGAERYLAIWVEPAQAEAIAAKLVNIPASRPSTHDLLVQLLRLLGASVDSIIICDLKNETYYAKILLHVDDRQMELDSRPSDALAIALRIGAPILVEEIVLQKAAFTLPLL